MDSTQLTTEQAETVHAYVGAMLCQLNAVTRDLRRLPVNDPLKVAAERARNAMQDLYMACHYASCNHGVGRPEKG